jgi:hypothetical protein
MACVTEQYLKGSDVAEHHPGWVVWRMRAVATRSASIQKHRNAPTGYVETVICDGDDYAELDRLLTEQDEIDKAHEP